jgi:hypothetical protein
MPLRGARRCAPPSPWPSPACGRGAGGEGRCVSSGGGSLGDDARRFRPDLLGIRARRHRRRTGPALGPAHVVGVADGADRPQLGVVHFGDAAILQEGRVGQRGLDAAHRLHGHLGGGGGLDPVGDGEFGDGFGEQRLVVRHHQDFFRPGAEAVRVVLHGEVGRGIERVAGRGLQDEARVRHPVVQPVPVLGLEMPFGGFGIQNPGVKAGRVGFFGALPDAGGARERALQQRGFHPLALAGEAARAQGGGDAEAGAEEGAEAGPLRGDEEGAVAVRALHGVGGDFEIGEGIGQAADVVERALRPAALFKHEPGARLHQRVDGGPLAVRVVAAVAGDRANNQAWVERRERRVVDAEPCRFARGIGFDQDVGGAGQREQGGLVLGLVQVQTGAALAALPDAIAELLRPGQGPCRVAPRGLDLDHVGAVVAEQHGGHRARDARGEVQYAQPVEYARHRASSRLCSMSRGG